MQFYVHPFYESELLPEEVMHQLPAFVEMHTLSQVWQRCHHEYDLIAMMCHLC